MKFKTVKAMALNHRCALKILWFVVEYGHGQLDEGRLSFLLVVHKLLNLQHFGLLKCQFVLEIEGRL
jgi:hypothetical protein